MTTFAKIDLQCQCIIQYKMILYDVIWSDFRQHETQVDMTQHVTILCNTYHTMSYHEYTKKYMLTSEMITDMFQIIAVNMKRSILNIYHSGRFHSVPVLHQSASVCWHLLSSPLPVLGQRSSGQAGVCGSVGLCFTLPGACSLLLKN